MADSFVTVAPCHASAAFVDACLWSGPARGRRSRHIFHGIEPKVAARSAEMISGQYFDGGMYLYLAGFWEVDVTDLEKMDKQ